MCSKCVGGYRFFNWQLESVIIHACFVVGWELRSNYDEFSEFCRFYIRIGLGNGIWLRHCIIICIYPYVDVPFRENPNGTYVASASPAALSIGSENQIPKIFMQFPSMETFSYQSCQSISLYFLNLLHGLLRSCQSFFEILMRFIHCWVKNRYWVCTSVSKPLMSLYWHLIKGKGSINECQMDGLDSHMCLSSLKLK